MLESAVTLIKYPKTYSVSFVKFNLMKLDMYDVTNMGIITSTSIAANNHRTFWEGCKVYN